MYVAVTSQGILQRGNAECRFHRDRQPPRQHTAAEPIEHDTQIAAQSCEVGLSRAANSKLARRLRKHGRSSTVKGVTRPEPSTLALFGSILFGLARAFALAAGCILYLKKTQREPRARSPAAGHLPASDDTR
jgi:hypothetical protein